MTTPLLTVIPLAAHELPLARSLFAHLATHPPIQFHAVLFVADHALPITDCQAIADLARPIFVGGGSMVRAPFAVTPAYPQAHNLRFETALKHVAAQIKSPFLYLSPRNVPVRAGWLLELENEYFAHARTKPVLGQLLTPTMHGTAATLVSSTAVYPHDLPKRVIQRLIAQRSTDFEQSLADILVPLTHETKLIWTHAVNGKNELPKPPAIASLVHTARAIDFAASLRGEIRLVSGDTAKLPPPKAPPELFPHFKDACLIGDTPHPMVPAALARAAYYHSGNLGDVIYGLAAIRLAGGGKLLLGPQQKRTPPPSNPIKTEAFRFLQPLLEAQSFLTKSEHTYRHPGTTMAFDLNRYRTAWTDTELRKRTGINTIARMHAHILGVDELWHPGDAWLEVPDPITLPYYVIHRSARYRNEAFPWDKIIERYDGRLLFVGLPAEHAAFQRETKSQIAFWQCTNALEMARVISGSLGFIGNQSFPCSLALACGQRVIQETWTQSPDCVLSRDSLITYPFSDKALDAWEKSIRATLVPIGGKKKSPPSSSRAGEPGSTSSLKANAPKASAISIHPSPTSQAKPTSLPAGKWEPEQPGALAQSPFGEPTRRII